MNVLVLGSGGREHALGWLLKKSSIITGLFFAEGNAGTAALGKNIPKVSSTASSDVVQAVVQNKIDFVFVGPEAPCAAGVVNALAENNIPVIGPNRASAELEASKVYSKNFLRRYNIPTAFSREFLKAPDFEAYILENRGKKLVIKKNGLAAGKGVLESSDRVELLDFGKSIIEHDSLLVEEFLTGWELSVFALTDGKTYKLLLPCADFKKAHDGDTGPNTGGMGSIGPVPKAEGGLMKTIEKSIVAPTFEALAKEGLSYKGILYFGIMVTSDGPKVLEYNIRLGDPESQVLLPLIKTDFGQICKAIIEGKLSDTKIEFHKKAALGVVIAAEGYPGSVRKEISVQEIKEPDESEAIIFHASTILTQVLLGTGSKGTQVLTNSGRCFTVVGLGTDLKDAGVKAYNNISRVKFDGAWFRTDIGKKFIS
ncbi:MAG: phosphoribosylamine--glycine ligase [Spirochaetaceae bacterium]|nr:MAG: phosphoribosylamine--glycine ligase [Spirochaetaceae bacterium]